MVYRSPPRRPKRSARGTARDSDPRQAPGVTIIGPATPHSGRVGQTPPSHPTAPTFNNPSIPHHGRDMTTLVRSGLEAGGGRDGGSMAFTGRAKRLRQCGVCLHTLRSPKRAPPNLTLSRQISPNEPPLNPPARKGTPPPPTRRQGAVGTSACSGTGSATSLWSSDTS